MKVYLMMLGKCKIETLGIGGFLILLMELYRIVMKNWKFMISLNMVTGYITKIELRAVITVRMILGII